MTNILIHYPQGPFASNNADGRNLEKYMKADGQGFLPLPTGLNLTSFGLMSPKELKTSARFFSNPGIFMFKVRKVKLQSNLICFKSGGKLNK